MGADIHLCFEKRNEKKEWVEIDIPERLMPLERDYELFYFLAGVRYSLGCDEPQFPDRGIPDDSSVQRILNPRNSHELRYTGSLSHAEHSFTHAYLDEILNAPWEKVGLQHRYFYVFCDRVLPRLATDHGFWGALEKRKMRVLMGFDS